MILALALTLLVPLNPTAAPAQESPQTINKRPAESVDRTAEDVEVMRRLLVKELGQHNQAANDLTPLAEGGFTTYSAFSTNGSVYTLGPRGSGVSHSRGFVVPGVGAVFAIDFEVPVREAQAPPKPDAPEGDDAWEEARREVHGGGTLGALALGRGTSYELDPNAIDVAVAAVVKVLGQHGGRIRGLGTGDSLVVALHITTSGRLTVTDGDALEKSPEGTLFWSSPVLSLSAPDAHIVVRLPLSVVRDYIDDRPDRSNLLERAVVTRY